VPKSASRSIENYRKEEDEFGAQDFSHDLDLKADHANRPLWIVNLAFNIFIFIKNFKENHLCPRMPS
jgi:hypothetical protein